MTESEDLTPQIPKLRENFLKEYEAAITEKLYDDRDLERLKTDDDYVLKFLKSRGLEEAPTFIDGAFKFRKEIGLNDMKEDSFSPEIVDAHVMYAKGVDKKDNPIIHFRLINHKSKAHNEDFKRYMAYLFEQYHRKDPFHRIVLMFDMSGCGVSNVDLDMTKFLIGIVKHFPQLLDYLLIYDMGWLLSAVWRVIKSWLTPEQLKYIKHVKKSEIQEYIDADNLEDHMK